MHRFKDLKIWQKSRVLVKDVYMATRDFPQSELYNLIKQIQRSAVSIPSNIAEGSGRGTKEFMRFLDVALSSSYELETQLIIACDLEFLTDSHCNKLTEHIDEIQKMIFSFKETIKNKA